MNPTARRSVAFRALLLGILALSSAATASAQLMVRMKLNKSHYMAYEAVRATVTVANRAGHDIVLSGPAGRSWLSFDIYDKGQLLSPAPSAIEPGQAFVLAAGKTITRTVTISNSYPFGRYGDYFVNASVYFPPLKRYMISNKERINITDSRAFWKQSVGVPGKRDELASFRRFSLHEHRDQTQSSLYMRLKDSEGPRVYATYSLGRYLDVRKPQATVDSQNRLHVLHMVGPRIYSHASVAPDGTFLGNTYFRETARDRPNLMIDEGGVVSVVGGTEYDPDKPPPPIDRPRMASERPPGLPGR